jgi:FkbM family methyltransferase
LLYRNLQRNGARNVQVIEAAGSNEDGKLRFHVAPFSAGSHVMSAGDLSLGAPAIDVPSLPLDRLGLNGVSLVMIDVEGHEPEVLAGARQLLERDRPWIIMKINLWCLSAYADHSPGAFVRTIWERFEVWSLSADGDIAPLGSGLKFLHDLLLSMGGAARVVLRPREGMRMPRLPELSWPQAAVALHQSNANVPAGESHWGER